MTDIFDFGNVAKFATKPLCISPFHRERERAPVVYVSSRRGRIFLYKNAGLSCNMGPPARGTPPMSSSYPPPQLELGGPLPQARGPPSSSYRAPHLVFYKTKARDCEILKKIQPFHHLDHHDHHLHYHLLHLHLHHHYVVHFLPLVFIIPLVRS